MVSPASPERRESERRHLVERRSPTTRRANLNRRRRDRRSVNLKLARQDRRSGVERRQSERRNLTERRCTVERRNGHRRRWTPSPYTVEQVAAVRDAFKIPQSEAICPVCGGEFTLGQGRRRGDETMRRVQCLSCGKSAVVASSWMKRVLVVADKEVVRDALRGLLEHVGHEVVDAADANVALWAYGQNPADVVFIDVAISGRLDAAEFIRLLRKGYPDARIVAISGRTSFGGRDPLRIAKQLGAVKTVRAPFSSAEILQILEEAQSD